MGILIRLFLAFAKVGTFSIGGGYAMLPFIQKEVIERNGWMKIQEFSDILAISQMTPGPVAVNSATYVGYKMGSIPGSIAATLGVVLPSFIMILIIAAFFVKFYERPSVQSIFKGIRPGVLGLLAAAAYTVTVTSVPDLKGALIFLASFGVLFIKKIDPIMVIIASAIVGIILY
jgi:chromate transporter